MDQLLPKFDNFISSNKRVIGGIALLATLQYTYSFVSSVAGLVRRQIIPGHNLAQRYGKGSYVAISACTDGIGKGFAFQFAKKGFNLVMLIRNEEKGKALAEQIKKTINPNIDIQIVVIDFLDSLKEGVIQAAADKLKNLDISILVNNVGMLLSNPCFEQQTETDIINMISMNVGAISLLTSKLIKQLRTRKQKSAILNLSSVAMTTPIAGLAMYGACKTFDDYFSRSLSEEYGNEIDIMCLRPGYVNTPMASVLSEKVLEIEPEVCAEKALRMLGRYQYTYGHIEHELVVFLQDIVVQGLNKRFRKAATQSRKN